jgi:ribonuclease P protein component
VLDRRHRLTTSAGFTITARRGRRAGTPSLVVHLLPDGDPAADGGPRVGFVVGKAVGNAVTRNRVKRRLRHLSRERLGSVPQSALLVVRALPGAADAGYVALGRDLDEALRRALARRPRSRGSARHGGETR